MKWDEKEEKKLPMVTPLPLPHFPNKGQPASEALIHKPALSLGLER